MAETSTTDPLDWDVDRVVQELCTNSRSWNPRSGRPVLPDPGKLEASLRENLIDGDALLFGSKESDFFNDIGVKIVKHKQTLRDAIEQLRARSRKYRLHTLRISSDDPEEDLNHNVRKRKLVMERNDPVTKTTTDASPNIKSPKNPTLSAPDEAQVNLTDQPDRAASNGVVAREAGEPSRKKRRIVPQAISSEVDRNVVRNIPTEADGIAERYENNVHIDSSETYLGEGAMFRQDILTVDENDADAEVVDFYFHKRHIAVGCRLQVNRILKRKLGGQEPVLRPSKADTVVGANDPTHNDIVPIGFGDSDEEYDSETWEEIEEEQKERAARIAAAPCKMTPEEVGAAIEKATTEIVTKWRESKLPKLEHKANRIWNEKRRYGLLKQAIDKERRDYEAFKVRLKIYREDIVRGEWHQEAEIKKAARSLEATIEDIQKSIWMLKLLPSPTEPQKLPGRPRVAVSKRQNNPIDHDDDEDVITSDSEDDLDNFVVDDAADLQVLDNEPMDVDMENGRPNHADITARETSTPVKGINSASAKKNAPVNGKTEQASELSVDATSTSEDDVIMSNHLNDDELEEMDLTQLPDSPSKTARPCTPCRSRNVIDLTTPEKEASDPNAKCTRHSSHTSGSHRASQSIPTIPWNNFFKSLNAKQRLTFDELNKLRTKYRNIAYRDQICKLAVKETVDTLWSGVLGGLKFKPMSKGPMPVDGESYEILVRLVTRLFDIFTDGKPLDFSAYDTFTKDHKRSIKQKKAQFPAFVEFIRQVAAYRGQKRATSSSTMSSVFESGKAPSSGRPSGKLSDQLHDKCLEQSHNEFHVKPHDSPPNKSHDESHDKSCVEESDDEGILETPSKKRGKGIVRDRAAQDLRERDRRRVEEQEQRRKVLRAKLAASGPTSESQKQTFLINESKEDDQGFIYVHDNIAQRIKQHQISGVRFMWNQIVMKSQVRQGCLLAHTMGLGKTMQIITLLVTIADAAASDDASISCQIPDDLKESRTLILAPPALINNWLDEFLLWAPESHNLGDFFKLDAEISHVERIETINKWADDGGILISGYNIFQGLMKAYEDVANIFRDKPNIVVADEAHMMKNPSTNINSLTRDFRTHSRIGLTGSPLANNVVEYHALINWVAPNYLSDLREFRQDYAKPIEEGLSMDSTPYQRRKALTKLKVLKDTVAPKVHRKTIAVLKDDLPPKVEFVLGVPLTEMQTNAYRVYMSSQDGEVGSTRIFASLNILALLCAHPSIFRSRLEEEKIGGQAKATGNVAKQNDSTPADGENGMATKSNIVSLPPSLISKELALLPKSGIDNLTKSWKMVMLCKILDESKRVGDKVLVFSQSLPTLDFIERLCHLQKRPCSRLDGKTNTNKRQNMVKVFNQDDCEVFLISTTAGGLGLNITGANRVVIFDIKFNPQNEQQAIGRAYRIGQKKPVFVYRFVCAATFEDKLLTRTIFKMQLASRVVDKKNPIPKAQPLEQLLEMPGDPVYQDLDSYKGKDNVLDSILNSETHRPGLCSIVMTDTFEEEAAEDAILTQEDHLEYLRLMEAQVARMGGQPVPAPALHAGRPLVPLNAGPPAYNAGQVFAPGPTAYGQDSGVGPSAFDGGPATGAAPNSHRVNPGQGDTATSNQANRRLMMPVGGDGTPVENGPVEPIRGGSTQLRHTSTHRVGSPPRNIVSNAQAVKGELARIFATAEAVSMAKNERRRIAQEICDALPEQQNCDLPETDAPIWAILNSAEASQRFVQAILSGVLSPRDLAAMDSDSIKSQKRHWDEMNKQQWDQMMQRGSIANKPGTLTRDIHKPLQPKSHRLDDQAALQELWQSGRNVNIREPRLPNWAREAVACEGRMASSSSASPAPTSSTPRHSARNPFR